MKIFGAANHTRESYPESYPRIIPPNHTSSQTFPSGHGLNGNSHIYIYIYIYIYIERSTPYRAATPNSHGGDAIKMGEAIGAATIDLEWVQVAGRTVGPAEVDKWAVPHGDWFWGELPFKKSALVKYMDPYVLVGWSFHVLFSVFNWWSN